MGPSWRPRSRRRRRRRLLFSYEEERRTSSLQEKQHIRRRILFPLMKPTSLWHPLREEQRTLTPTTKTNDTSLYLCTLVEASPIPCGDCAFCSHQVCQHV